MAESPQALRAGLIGAGFKSLFRWAIHRGVNYNTAYAAMRGLRHGPAALHARKLMLRDIQRRAPHD